MKIVGVLSWFDESPTWLSAAVTGFARVCDTVVAVDGAYGLYPGARARSRPDQAEAILHTCEAAGVGCVVWQPDDVWHGNEVEKRNHSFQLAGMGLTSDDWIMVFDADYHVLQCDPDVVRWELASTSLNCGTYTILDGIDLSPNEHMEKWSAQTLASTEWTCRTRDIYRWTPDLRYDGTHYCVTGTYDGHTEWLRGPEGADLVEPVRLEEALVVHHRTAHRPKVRRDNAEHYYKTRDLVGIETVPGALGAAA